MKLLTYIALSWITSFTISFLVPLTLSSEEHSMYIHIMLALIFSSLNTVLIYIVLRDYYMGVNWQTNSNKEELNIDKEEFGSEASSKNDSNPFGKYIDKFEK